MKTYFLILMIYSDDGSFHSLMAISSVLGKLVAFLPVNHTMAIRSFTMKSQICFFSMNFDSVSKTRYLLKSAVVKICPFVAKLQIALLKTFKVKTYSIRQKFSIKEAFRFFMRLYLLTSLPCLEKFSQITERIARMSFLLGEFSSSSQSILKTVIKNFLVKGKQNLGFYRMSYAMMDKTQSIRISIFMSLDQSYQYNLYLTSSILPSLVKWFIIFLMRSIQVIKTEVQPFMKRQLTPFKHCSKDYPSSVLIISASWLIDLAADISSSAQLRFLRRNSKGGFSMMIGEQEAQDQVEPVDAISDIYLILEGQKLKIIIIYSFSFKST